MSRGVYVFRNGEVVEKGGPLDILPKRPLPQQTYVDRPGSIRGCWVIRNGEFVSKSEAPPLNEKLGNAPMLIRDCMDPTLNHADGRKYDSKRAYEKAVRAAGCEIVGNEKLERTATYQEPSEAEIAQDFKQAAAEIAAKTPTLPANRRKLLSDPD